MKSCQKTMDNDSHNGEDAREKEVEEQEYRARQKNISRLITELRREADQARERWWKNECNELEELDRSARPDLMHAQVGQLTRKKTTNCTSDAIKDETGKLLTEPAEIRNRWKEYTETLYDKNGKPQDEEMGIELELDVDEDSKGPVILDSEVTNAIEILKVGKAIGPDGMPAEFWKVLGAKGTKELVEPGKEMYVKGIWSSDFTRVVMIPLQKKMKAIECRDHRTVSLISHASTILLKLLTNRIGPGILQG